MLSDKCSNLKFRNHIPGVKKQISLGNDNYKLIDNENSQKALDSKIILTFFIVMIVSIVVSLLINLIIPFIMYNQRVIAPLEEIKAQGDDITKVNELLSKYSNAKVMWINLLGVLVCATSAVSLLVTSIIREVKKTKKEKVAKEAN